MASDLGLHCLLMSHKKVARLIWVERSLNLPSIRMFCWASNYLEKNPDLYNNCQLRIYSNHKLMTSTYVSFS